MAAIVPVNVAALRVSKADESNVTGKFVGESVAFDQLQYGASATQASTGDVIWRPLQRGDSPIEKMRAGVHLHWELPEFFKQGKQNQRTGAIKFPAAPNRWLVVRSASKWDAVRSAYGEVRHKTWVVESDYVAPTPQPDNDGVLRPTVSVPLTDPATGAPYQYMGRVVAGDQWAGDGPSGDYLPSYAGADGKPLKLTSIGFVGPAFSGYYPDCRSVFGFWDTFADDEDLGTAINAADPIRFRASYRVVGWLPAADDPLTELAAAREVADEWEHYAHHCAKENVPVIDTPADVFERIASERFGWAFPVGSVTAAVSDGKVIMLDGPTSTLCAGTVQDIVWDQTDPSEQTPFLTTPDGAAVWEDRVDIAIGNTTVEAVSALIKQNISPPAGRTGVLGDYEALLDALQLGLLHDLESDGNALPTLHEALHARSFSQVDGGHTWTIQAAATAGAQTASAELTLPLALAEQLAALNRAQRSYDQARQRLAVARQQLFMDWVIYVKQVVTGGGPPIDQSAYSAFLATSTGGELNAVIRAGERAGLLHYDVNFDNVVTGVSTVSASGSDAGKVVTAHDTVAHALSATKSDWQLDAVPAAPYASPTDPVLVMEGSALEPVRRNGPTLTIPVRTDVELLDELTLAAAEATWTVSAAMLADGLPAAPPAVPHSAAATAYLVEASLLDPQHAAAIAATTSATDKAQLATAIAETQGGRSPLEGAPLGGLFDAIRANGWIPTQNPAITVQAPLALTTTFTNTAATAWSPDPVGWNAQRLLKELANARVDPFLPLWLTWDAQLDPLAHDGDYAPDTITHDFDPTSLAYPLPAKFTTGEFIGYHGAVALSKKPIVSLTQQIDRYIADYPLPTQTERELRAARDDFAARRVFSQALGGFGLSQTLRLAIPQLPVENLQPGGDEITDAIAAAANATPDDSWYDTGFNAVAPLSVGLQADFNFGPLRAGFLEIRSLGIVDAFGQHMALTTEPKTNTGALGVQPTGDLTPMNSDTVNAARAYLPPRVLAPTRIDAFFLSARHDRALDGDFVETNDHPASSPVCGWIVPNHLEDSLAFYDERGRPIGSFGIEHGEAVYRTRAGNLTNPTGTDLAPDIGPPGEARINAHLAELMWFIHHRSTGRPPPQVEAEPGFLIDLMASIARSDQFVNPAATAQDGSLAVFMGRPLAVVRSIVSLSTAGDVVPASQSTGTLVRAVHDRLTEYSSRQSATSAGLDKVVIPLQLGVPTHTDDGLIAFLPERGAGETYSTLLSAFAPEQGQHGVTRPGKTALPLTLGGPAITITAIVDPRSPVRVCTPLLPTVTLRVPPDQYLRAMQQLALTFTTRPVLRDTLDFRLPLPSEPGFAWSWIAPGCEPAPLRATPAPDVPIRGYGPQRLLEGWLDLSAAAMPPTLVPHPNPPLEGSA